jgi:hypothetical protein
MSGRKLFALALLLFCCTSISSHAVHAQTAERAQTVDRAQAAAEIASLREQIKAREALLLSVPQEDQRRYAEFLAQPRTGLIRLLPREKWMMKLSTPGDGAFYSFAHLTHEYGQGSDVMLEQGQFSVGFAGADFGLIVKLGDVPLESATGETDGVKFLSEYNPPTAEKEARAAHMSTYAGLRSGEWVYRSRVAAVVGNTYALRSVSYDRSDVLVVFRVVREDEDDSVVLLWKMLKKFPTPPLERDAPVAGS